mgnify:FL=1
MDLKNSQEDAKNLGAKLKDVANDAAFTENALKSIAQTFKDAISEAIESTNGLDSATKKVGSSISRDIVNGIKKLGPSLEKSISLQQKLSEGQDITADLLKEQQKTQATRLAIEARILQLKNEGIATDDLEVALLSQISAEESEISRLNEQQNTISQNNASIIEEKSRLLGVSGGILKGINSIAGEFGKAFNLDQVATDMDKVAESIAKGEKAGNRLTVVMAGIGSATKNAFSTLTDPAVIIGSLLKGFASVDKANVDFQRTTGQNANTLGNSYSVATGELITLSQYIQQASDLSKELGMNAMDIFSAEDLLQVSTMQKTMGMSVKESNQLAILSKINGNSVRDNNKSLIAGVNAFNGQNKQGVLAKTVLKDVANVSEDIALTYLGYPEKLGAAATAAASMGTNLSGVAKIAEGLLNFESSIAAEMEAELLTGQSLNLEKARQFALMNDLEGVATELLNQGITSLSYSKLNFIQQKAQAAALGMTRAEMSKMLMTQGLSVNMSKVGLSDMQKQTLESMEQQEVQEKLSAAVAKMQQAFAPIVGFIADIVSNTVVLNSILAVVAGTYVVKMGLGFLRMVGYTGSILTNMGLMSKLGGTMSKVGSLGSSLLPTPTKAPVKVPGGVVAKKNLTNLAAGLKKMGTGAAQIALGIVNLGLFGVAGAIALLAIPFLRSFQTINGIAIETNFVALATGLTSFGIGTVTAGIGNLSLLGLAGILMTVGSIGLGLFAGAAYLLSLALPPLTIALSAFASNPLVAIGIGYISLLSLSIGASFALIGAGAMMMGKGISLAASGFSVMVPHILSLIPQIPALGLLALSLMGIGAGLAYIAVAGLAAIPALMGLAALATISAGIYSTFSGDEEGGDSDKGMAKINANLEKLISLVEAGGNVYLDGAEMGKIVSMSDSRMG